MEFHHERSHLNFHFDQFGNVLTADGKKYGNPVMMENFADHLYTLLSFGNLMACIGARARLALKAVARVQYGYLYMRALHVCRRHRRPRRGLHARAWYRGAGSVLRRSTLA